MQRYTASHRSIFFFSKDSKLDIVVAMVGEVLLLNSRAEQRCRRFHHTTIFGDVGLGEMKTNQKK